MNGIHIELDKKQLRHVMRKFDGARKKTPGKIRNATNRAATAVRKELFKQEKASYTDSGKEYKAESSILRASPSHQDAIIRFETKKMHNLATLHKVQGHVPGKGGAPARVAVVSGGGMKDIYKWGNKGFTTVLNVGSKSSPGGNNLVMARQNARRKSMRSITAPSSAGKTSEIWKGNRGNQDMEKFSSEKLSEMIQKQFPQVFD